MVSKPIFMWHLLTYICMRCKVLDVHPILTRMVIIVTGGYIYQYTTCVLLHVDIRIALLVDFFGSNDMFIDKKNLSYLNGCNIVMVHKLFPSHFKNVHHLAHDLVSMIVHYKHLVVLYFAVLFMRIAFTNYSLANITIVIPLPISKNVNSQLVCDLGPLN